MSVLAQLGDQKAGPAPRLRHKLLGPLPNFGYGAGALTEPGCVDPSHLSNFRLVTAKDLLQGITHLTHSSLGARRGDRQLQQISLTRSRGLGQRSERRFESHAVALATQLGKPTNLCFADGAIVDFEDLDSFLALQNILVDTDNRLNARVDVGLGPSRSLFNPYLGDPGFDRLGHAPELLALIDVGPSPVRQLVGQAFDEVTTAPRINHHVGVRFLLEEELCVAGDPGREVGGQS
jgi:hypothetical protein